MSHPVPEGYQSIDFGIPFLQLIGPVYHKVGAPVLHLAMRIEHKHCNALGSVHGGLLATLADVASVRALVQARNNGQRAFTISLNTDYIGQAVEGDWIEAHITIKKGSGGVAFALCEIKVDDKLIVVSSGSFKFFTPSEAS
ncbi:PaaI family thioesterase [Halioxenophilus aromaticivorans]|uniref:PaaI family thioesterase n=1 Tax=Halioxenophilus aromaticivorans TaxID=1306992 RepID=A0AAV3U988_9ALTE